MKTSSRRAFLRSGIVLGAGALLGAPALRSARAAQTQTLVLYNGQHAKTTTALVAAFTKATGIQVEIRKGSSTQLANQIIEEGNRSPADVFYAEESPPVAALAEKQLLAALPESTLSQVRPGYTARDKTWTGVTARSRVTVYNKDMIQASELPGSVMDMATAAWKDRVGFVPTSGAFQEQIIAIKLLKGRDAALNWLKGLKEFGRIYNGNMAAMRAVERGEIATALVNNYYWYIVANEVGTDKMKAGLHYSAPKDPGCLITVSAAGVLKTARNPDAAQKLLAFMVSQAGQEAVVDTVAEYPLRAGVKSPFDLKPFDQLMPPAVSPADLGDAADAIALRREAGLA
ncbi:extracellular solute-binding protein [Castellaniella caeni]|uniref:extracellular solute-binding protein n=1 Tax=Castellaniella caeni TaxID=266123 RepID=UPI00083722FE|nr:extracellular solute-binding protein [Castellaniella caeni]